MLAATKRKLCSDETTGKRVGKMRSNKTRELFLYWNRLRNGRIAPKRHEVEPADIKSLLSCTFILEKDARGQAVFRLAGTQICAYFGRELKGFGFLSFWAQKESDLIGRLVEDTFNGGGVSLIGFEGISRNNRVAQFEMVVLMLDGGHHNPRAIGAISSLKPEFWLGADPIIEAHLTSIRVIDPDREPMMLKNRPDIRVPSLQPAAKDVGQIANTENPRGGRRIQHLVVLPGGKSEKNSA